MKTDIYNVEEVEELRAENTRLRELVVEVMTFLIYRPHFDTRPPALQEVVEKDFSERVEGFLNHPEVQAIMAGEPAPPQADDMITVRRDDLESYVTAFAFEVHYRCKPEFIKKYNRLKAALAK